jgi:hypothetical protein
MQGNVCDETDLLFLGEGGRLITLPNSTSTSAQSKPNLDAPMSARISTFFGRLGFKNTSESKASAVTKPNTINEFFLYRDLKSKYEICLVIINPTSASNDPIIALLDHIILEDRPRYKALSYI